MILARGMAGGSQGNYFFGALFLVISALFVLDGFRGKMQFILPASGWRKYATLGWLVIVCCYPAFGLLAGHDLKSLIFPGTYPCPTIALALILLTMALPQVDKVIYILLLFLAIPFTPFYQIARYGVYEDVILFAAGLYSLVLLFTTRRQSTPKG